MTRVAIRPELLRWARERAGILDVGELQGRFPKLGEWETGEAQPTLKQLEAFAQAVHVPIGYLFLPEPPGEPLPIPDFRTHDGRGVRRASPELLDMLYACQERQGWYRDFALTVRMPQAAFVGSAALSDRLQDAASSMAETLGFDVAARAACRTWEEALRLTTLDGWQTGQRINLERSLRIGDELGGHMVSGHVDGLAEIVGVRAEGEATRFTLEAPQPLAKFIAPKGSVALDGTSLTVNGVEGNRFDVLLIAHTLEVTTWGDRAKGDPVNLEVDQMARYAARLMEAREG